jgi:hypothetical protein
MQEFNHEGHEEHEALARSLEPSEGSEKKMKSETFGSLKNPHKVGCPDTIISGQMGSAWWARVSELTLVHLRPPIEPLSDPAINARTHRFNKFEFSEVSVDSVRDKLASGKLKHL